MTLTSLAKRLEKLMVDNSPVILTAIGVTGTLTTAFLTGKATIKACDVIDREELWVDNKRAMKRVWKFYIPPASSAAVTIACIILANRIGNRRAAALAAVYAISEKAFDEYRMKVVEKIGEKRERSLRDEVAQDRITNNPVGTREVIITGVGDVLCYEVFTGRYFNSDMEALRKAENDINHEVLHNSYASLTDFYYKIGLRPTGNSDEVGWNADKMLELEFSATISDDGRPCISVDFVVAPVRHYNRLS